MKTMLCPLFVLALVLLTGCGQQSTDAPGEKSVARQEIEKTATTVVAEAAPEVKTQAKEAFANLSQQLVQVTKGGSTDALLKNISTDLESRVGKLSQSLTTDAAVQAQLNTTVQALLGNKDTDAIGTLNQLKEAGLTPQQTALAKDVYNATAAFVTQRNFSAIEGMNTEVTQLVNAVWKGDYKQAVTPLQKLYSQATLTPAQKDLLGKTFDQYMPAGWKDAAGKLQQGVDSLKKIGL